MNDKNHLRWGALYVIVTILSLVLLMQGMGSGVPFRDRGSSVIVFAQKEEASPPEGQEKLFNLDISVYRRLLRWGFPFLQGSSRDDSADVIDIDFKGVAAALLNRFSAAVTGVKLRDPYTLLRATLPGLPSEPILESSRQEFSRDPVLMPPVLEGEDQGNATPDDFTPDERVQRLLEKGRPLVLIYHTHAQESYLGADFAARGLDKNDAFSANAQENMLRVGEEFARHLYRTYGIKSVQIRKYFDRTDERELTKAGAYLRALPELKRVLDEHRYISVMLDIHRDSLPASTPFRENLPEFDDRPVAKPLLVIGRGLGVMLPHSNWQHNLRFARSINGKLQEEYPGLSRGVMVDKARYNQHLSPGAVLLEVGSVRNDLGEALRLSRILAEVIGELILEGRVPGLTEVMEGK